MAAVSSGKVAPLAGGTPDLNDATAFGVGFGPSVFLDGQGFLVRTGIGMATIKGLANRQVCFITETQAKQALNDKLEQRRMRFIPFPFEEPGEMQAALVTGHRAAIAGTVSALANMRIAFHARKAQFATLPETITLKPFVRVYRLGGPPWATIVTWTLQILILAEEAGVTQDNAAALRDSGRPDVRYLLGGAPGVGKLLGLDDAWALRAIGAAGNYGEMFERDLGANSPLQLARGHNALWTQDGLIYAPPSCT